MRDPALTLPEPPPDLAELSTRLCTRIAGEIESAGPISFSRYMEMALYEPGLGYYVNGLYKFGRHGDFITAPEQGKLFAAGLARQFDSLAAVIGSDWTLLELGPGSGALARDLLEALACPPARYLLLETSAPLREVQMEMLRGLPEDLAARVEWLNAPPQAGFDGVVLANEVVDALPVACFETGSDGPSERRVGFDGHRFQWHTAAPPTRLTAALEQMMADLPEPLPPGYRSEIRPDLGGWLETVTAPLESGLVLLVDYGYPRREYYHPDRSAGTLVCHYRHRAHFDPFVYPGLTDISAFVDFTAVAEAAEACGLKVSGFTHQAGFLLGLGVHDLVEQASDVVTRLQLASELKHLTLPGEMGEKFKVMALTRNLDWPPAGFELSDHLRRL